ncbi:MAG TPA: class I SAM-dependent methyltransferase [Flavobacteriia bacterium]|nr:class I SAM-dependent methyltransferase [Flavobacteriia bacterium]
MKRGQISTVLRKLNLIYFTDWIRFYIEKNKNKKDNLAFKKKFPNVILPPDYMIYESFQMNYKKYYLDGKKTSIWLKKILEKHIKLENKTILDWGCGPVRILRHLPETVNNNCEFYGTDYNPKTINWCKKNLKNINFNHNSLQAKLAYDNDFFDIIYGISIFTHLSKPLHYDWFKELYRILKPNGILLLTTQGENFKSKLTKKELNNFNQGKLVVRGNVKEGHRTYSAFHPKLFMQKLFDEASILEHIEPKAKNKNKPPQDIWIIKKIT